MSLHPELQKGYLQHLPVALQTRQAQWWASQDSQDTWQQELLAQPSPESWLKLVIASPFAAKILAEDPSFRQGLYDEQSPWLADDQRWQTLWLDLVKTIEDRQQLMAAARWFRQRRCIAIMWQDIRQAWPIEQVSEQLSQLADWLIDQCLQWLLPGFQHRYGHARDKQGKVQQLAVIGLGKLGGGELNFSSDVDLLFLYEQEGESDGPRPLSNEMYFRRLGQQLIGVLNELTAEGFVYRVDMRLRPFGDAGALAVSLPVAEKYYQTHGREWERYALIKARGVAGDLALAQQFIELLQPFIYRRYLDYGAIDELRQMKAMIAKEIAKKNLQQHIKLGCGGIREIEFIVQLYQLIHGGQDQRLQGNHLLTQLTQLQWAEHLSNHDTEKLANAYRFLRRVENRLQYAQDQQTHQLPECLSVQVALAWSMGFADWCGFYRKLQQHRNHVNGCFNGIFAEPDDSQAQQTLTAIQAVNSQALKSALVTVGFEDPDTILQRLKAMRNSFFYRQLGSQARKRLHHLLPSLLAQLVNYPQPEAVLNRVLQVIKAIGGRSVYLALLREHPEALARMIKFCAASQWMSELLARWPILLDELVTIKSLATAPDKAYLQRQLQQQLQVLPSDDEEALLDGLRAFRRGQILRISAADITENMPLMRVSDHLTQTAEVVLEQVLQQLWQRLIARYGAPHCGQGNERRPAHLAIIAYGKLGGMELGYGSDLDLVFLHDSSDQQAYTEGPHVIENDVFFARLVRKMIHWLTTPTAQGILYPVDTRLRPSGASGLLVATLKNFQHYQNNQAWVWEHQALLRARKVAGSDQVATAFQTIRHEVLSRPRDLHELRQAVLDMRDKMRQNATPPKSGYFDLKQGSGGIVDIEFLVQFLLLKYASTCPDLLRYSDNIRQIAGLEWYGLLPSVQADELRTAYRSLRQQAHRLALQKQPGHVELTQVQPYNQQVQRIWQHVMALEDKEHVNNG